MFLFLNCLIGVNFYNLVTSFMFMLLNTKNFHFHVFFHYIQFYLHFIYELCSSFCWLEVVSPALSLWIWNQQGWGKSVAAQTECHHESIPCHSSSVSPEISQTVWSAASFMLSTHIHVRILGLASSSAGIFSLLHCSYHKRLDNFLSTAFKHLDKSLISHQLREGHCCYYRSVQVPRIG